MKWGTALAWSVSILLLFGTTASAAIITFGYTATGSSGVTVTGTFGYEDSVAPFHPVPTTGVYFGAGFLTGSVVGGPQDGAIFDLSGLDPFVQNGASSDRFGLEFQTSGGALTFLRLRDPSTTAFGDFILPTMLTLSDFATRELFLGNQDIGLPGTNQVGYTLQSITNQTTPVPIPSTTLLFSIGLAALAACRWKANNRH